MRLFPYIVNLGEGVYVRPDLVAAVVGEGPHSCVVYTVGGQAFELHDRVSDVVRALNIEGDPDPDGD